ncbi:hypothetical protein ACD591_16145 [Rufibacter glacialis]|uniref:Uncharacterized protein n=1 Tax=Rufibacter glacialis TaxID=1259555 RepID=A0A5M8QN11_9BACT|nr:hypothetical protein [Rufibacter glacialis]KAA6437525.1 hypothetical protein FOE74_03200 [Rufibacter glacialis]GGK58596.1 hypothetical protein GCM10011405_03360 [Rufibacter glacialis]
MLEYVKLILSKVSFDSSLFEKELRKSMRMLVQQELEILREWCYTHFSGTYSTILDKVFRNVMVA